MVARKQQTGLSMVEVMIAMLIMAVISSQALGMLSSQLQTFHTQKRVLDAQQDARLVADLILVDLRMAGFMVPNKGGVSSVDGGTSNTDSLCVSEWSTFDETELKNASARFDRATVTSMTASTVTLTAAEMDVDGDGDDDFVVNEGIIVSDDNDSHCATITTIAGNVVTFTPAYTGWTDAPAVGEGRAVPAIVYNVSGSGITRNGLVLSSQVEDLQIE